MKVCQAGRSDKCCGPSSVKTINTMPPDDNGEFKIRAGTNVNITMGTNEMTVDAQIPDEFDDLTVNGTLEVNGDIIQQGAAYETHAEHVFSTDDYIIMRDGALVGLASGDYSGFQVKKYDGTNDGRLVIDGDGVARVGDVGDEQPLLTRDEAADLVDGAPLVWDAANLKAISGSAGGGEWTERPANDDWSDILTRNANTTATTKYDLYLMSMSNSSYMSFYVYIPKGITTNNIPLTILNQSSNHVIQATMNLYTASSNGNSITLKKNIISVNVDFVNQTASLSESSTNPTIPKNQITVLYK